MEGIKKTNRTSHWSKQQLCDKVDKLEIEMLQDKKKYEKKINELSDLLNKKDIELNKLKAEAKKYKSQCNILTTDDVKIKKILELRARKDDTTLIQQKMNNMGISIEIEEIEDICLNIDSLGVEYVEFYNECLEKFEKQLKINPTILKNKNLENNLFSIDEIKKMISETGEPDTKLKLINQLDVLTKTNVKILEGGIVTDKEDVIKDNINESMNKLDKINESISFVVEETLLN